MDSWAWLVFADAADPAHREVLRLIEELSGKRKLVTTDFVLDETFTRLFSRSPFRSAERFGRAVFEAEEGGLVRVERITPERFAEAWNLRLRYRDKPDISFTDLTSFVVMNEMDIRVALTGDDDFIKVQLGFRKLP